MVDEVVIRWSFMERYESIIPLSDKVGYQWKCTHTDPADHVIECLWVWHDCDMHLDPERGKIRKRSWEAIGWQPTGIGLHDLIQVEPLHVEASVYWPACCGMHGWIRNGIWIDA